MNDKKLIKLYLEGRSKEQIGKQLGYSASSVGQRLSALRKLGVHLPYVKRSNSPSVEDLNAYIDKLTGGNGGE